MQIRIGVIGVGESWERRHKLALVRLSDKFEVRAVYDEVAHRAKVAAAELECDAVDGFTSLVERDDVDAVYILGTSWLGVEPVRTACHARKAIYLGTPFGPEMAYADETIDLVRSSGVRFMAEFPWRFYPATIRLMELLASGLGTPQLANCEQNVLFRETHARSNRTRASAELEQAEVVLHMADWLRFVFGREPVRVQSPGEQKFDYGPCRKMETFVADFGQGGVGRATACHFADSHWVEATRHAQARCFQVVAEHGVAYVEMPGQITWFDSSGRHEESLEMERSLGEMLSDRFYRIVVHGLNPSPSLADAAAARAIVLEARAARPAAASREVRHLTAG